MEIQLGPSLTEKFEHLTLSRYDVSPDMSAASTPSSTPSTPVTEGYYDIRPIKTDDTDKVIQFLRKFFFRDEPLNIEQNLLETDEDTCPELEGYSIKSMHEGISLMAVAPAGDIVGICLNGVMDRQDPDEEEYECANEKFARILKLLDTVDREADVFGQFPDVNKIISVKILSVDGSWRGKGIAKALMDRTRELAREMGHTLMRVDCTSHYSARAVARLGFECVYTLKYADYKENGKPVFVPEPPHSEVKVYTQRVA
ncbi:speck [Carabus blaptoides fortunei]